MEPPIAPGESLVIEVIGEPRPAGSKTAFKNPKTDKIVVRPDNSGQKPWMNSVAEMAVVEWAPRDLAVLDEPVYVVVTFYVPRKQSHFRKDGTLKDSAPLYPHTGPFDLDKLCRSTLDALEGFVYVNDRRVVTAPLRRRWGTPARAEIKIRRLRATTVGDLRRLRDLGDESAAEELAQLELLPAA